MDDITTADGALTRRLFTGVRRYVWVATIAILTAAAVEIAVFGARHDARAFTDGARDRSRIAREAQRDADASESRLRFYVLSHDPRAFERAAVARRALDTALDSLDHLVGDDPAQQRRIRELARALEDWDNGWAVPARDGRPVESAGAPALFEPVRTALAEFVASDDAVFDARLRDDANDGWLAMAGILFPLAVVAAILIALLRRLSGQESALGDQQQRLEEQAVELEMQIERLEAANREQRFAVAAAEEAREQARYDALERARAMAMLDAALASAPLGFAFLDADFRCLRVNRALAGIRGLDPETLYLAALHDTLPKPLADAITRQLGLVMQTRHPRLDVRVQAPGADGRQCSWVVNCYPVLASGDELLGLGVMVLDITDRAELEEQIRQSQKMEAIGRLAGGVAHDFNNLLTVIRSYCDLVLLDTLEDDPRHEELVEIRSAAERAAALARQLLAFSRKQVFVPKVLDLNGIVAGLESMLSRVLPDAVDRELRLGTGIGHIKADPGHVEQVLLNLVINAADAMPDGGRLTIATANVEIGADDPDRRPDVPAGEYVMVSVSDTGTGMDEATMRRVFEPFFTTKPPGKGTGLGLSTVYGIVKQAGGWVRVSSDVGRGTTFRIFFPHARAEVDVVPRAPVGSAPVRATEVSTVLIVEDEDAVRATLARILQRQGLRILEAAHGGEAMRMAKEHPQPIHLVISDLMMPGMNGREFVERFSVLHPESRVLFMSGYTDDDAMIKDLVSERQAFIEKPFTVEQITRKVREALDGE
ncbi:MAG: response regulator [Proteobacteria bacterium]|nr:response regulator [Pseudomonadota bacterium]